MVFEKNKFFYTLENSIEVQGTGNIQKVKINAAGSYRVIKGVGFLLVLPSSGEIGHGIQQCPSAPTILLCK